MGSQIYVGTLRGCNGRRLPSGARTTCPRIDPATHTGRAARTAWVSLTLVTTMLMTGCGGANSLTSQPDLGGAPAVTEQSHTRSDVMFALDIIDHSAQAIALSNPAMSKQGIAPMVRDIAQRISATSTTNLNQLQTLLQEWGFAPPPVGQPPTAAAPSLPVAPGEHPLAVDADVRRAANATGPDAGGQYLDLMIRQHHFTISAARDQLQTGSNPRARAIARSLIERQQSEIVAMEALQR